MHAAFHHRLVGNLVDFLLPDGQFFLDLVGNGGDVLLGHGVAQLLVQLFGSVLGVGAQTHGDGVGLGDVHGVDVDLDDLGRLGEVVDAVLGQGAEVGQAAADGQNDVGLFHEAHGGMGAHVADGAAPQRMIRREGVIVQVAAGHGRADVLGQGFHGFHAVGVHHAAAGHDHGILGVLEHFNGVLEHFRVADAAGGHAVLGGFQNFLVQLAIEVVAGHVHQHGAAHGVGGAESGAQDVAGAVGMGHAQGSLGDGLEQVPRVAFLEAVPAHGGGTGAGRNDDHGRVGHVGGGHGGHIVGDAGAVLADDHAGLAGHAAEGVLHVAGGLLVTHGDEVNARGREEVQQVHVGGTENTADVFDAFFHQNFGHGLTGSHFRHGCSFAFALFECLNPQPSVPLPVSAARRRRWQRGKGGQRGLEHTKFMRE